MKTNKFLKAIKLMPYSEFKKLSHKEKFMYLQEVNKIEDNLESKNQQQ